MRIELKTNACTHRLEQRIWVYVGVEWVCRKNADETIGENRTFDANNSPLYGVERARKSRLVVCISDYNW